MKLLNTYKALLLVLIFSLPITTVRADEEDDRAVSIGQILQVYATVHDPLVADNLKKAQDGAKTLGTFVSQWISENPNSAQKADVLNIEKAGSTLAAAEDLDDARKAFIQLSQGTIALIRADKSLQAKWQLFYCPMVAKNQGYWTQPLGEQLANPYMGGTMPGCGSKKPW